MSEEVTRRYCNPPRTYNGGERPIQDDKYADLIRVPADLDLPTVMADWYLLERMRADGSKRAALMFKELTDHFAPIIARYMVTICGGELRHIRSRSGCGGCACGCDCNCGIDQECGCSNPYPDCMCGYDWEHEPHACMDHMSGPEDSVCELNGECEEDCKRCAWESDPEENCPSSCYAGCRDCHWLHDDSWQSAVPMYAWDTILNGYDYGRDGSWRTWVGLAEEIGWLKCAEACVIGFTHVEWEEGFGGESWASIARLARDYLQGKINGEIFLNMAWSLQHNGGIMFNKMWSYNACGRLQDLLARQAADKYEYLYTTATPDTAKVWQSRRWALTNYEDHDPTWFGAQPTSEVVW